MNGSSRRSLPRTRPIREARHVYDDGPAVGWQLASADVAILDISAMVYDRLAVGKPLLITRPAEAMAEIDQAGFLSDCEWLTANAAGDVVGEVDRVEHDEAARARLQRWVAHYFGDTRPGVATAKFHSALERLMNEWDAWHENATGTGTPRRTPGTEPQHRPGA